MKESKWEWNPGSASAVELGCTCAQMDNDYGKGSGYLDDDGNPTFWINGDCPLHGLEATDDKSS